MRFSTPSLLLAASLVGFSAAPAAASEASLEAPFQIADHHESKGEGQTCPMCGMRHGGKMKGHGMKGHGMMGHGTMGWYQKLRRHAEGHYWRGPEVLYHTGLDLSGTANPVAQYLDVGMYRRFEFNDFFALGFRHHLAYQLNPATGQGNWIVPWGGVDPRLGLTLGPVRVDVGATAGLGGMFRTTPADVLQARLTWLLEPNAELSYRMPHMSIGLRGGYMMSPNPGEFGSATVGLRVGFGGFYSAAGAHKGHDQSHDHDHD